MRRFSPLLLCLPLLTAAIAGCPNKPSTIGTPGPDAKEAPWFEDITSKVGLDFTHDPGPTPQPNRPYFMPQNIGSGGAVFDFDGDGRLDLYLVNNAGPNGAKNRLFHQEPDGTFRDVSAGSGLDVAEYGQ